MNKGVLAVSGLTALLLVGAVGAPKVSGLMLEQHFRESAGSLPGLNEQLHWEVTSFERGWFESRAESVLTIRLGDESHRVYLQHQLQQMPGLDGRHARIYTTPVSSESLGPLVPWLNPNQEPIEIVTTLMLNGKTRSSIRVDGVEGKVNPGGSSWGQWSGLNGFFDTAPDGRVHFAIHSPLFMLLEEDRRLEVHSIRLTGELGDPSAAGYVVGDMVFEMGRLQIDEAGSPQAVLDGLRFASSSQRDGEMIDGALDFGFTELAIDGESYRDGRLRLGFERFDAAALEMMTKLARAGELGGLGLLTNALALIRHSPSLSLEQIQLTSPAGRFEGRAKVALDFNAQAGQALDLSLLQVDGYLVSSLALLESSLVRGLQVQLARAGLVEGVDYQEEQLIELAREQIAEAIDMGWLKEQGDSVRTDFELTGGQLLANGMPLPLIQH